MTVKPFIIEITSPDQESGEYTRMRVEMATTEENKRFINTRTLATVIVDSLKGLAKLQGSGIEVKYLLKP